MKKIRIAILGFGNVGQGVWKILAENKLEIMKHSGYEIEVAKILVKDLEKKRGVEVPSGLLTNSFDEILYDDSIGIVVELIGGAEPSKDYMLRSMRAKKHVVTANKLVLAKSGHELFETASQEQVLFYYEASVGGGIPIIKGINESLTANKIEQITGIINGTTNYILTKMTYEGMSFEDALAEAQEMGYAEADPTSDVEGFDVGYKLAIMSSLAFGSEVDPELIYREGITKIKPVDIEHARKFGYVIKLLAIGKEDHGEIELRVHPAFVPKHHPIANVNDSFNAIFLKGNAIGDLMLYGRGAGDLPTGSAVVGDIITILKNNLTLHDTSEIKGSGAGKDIKPFEKNRSRFYVRLNVKDVAGVLGEVTTILGKHNVSIVSVNQDIMSADCVSLVFVTHTCLEGDMETALSEMKGFDAVNEVESMIRIEMFQ